MMCMRSSDYTLKCKHFFFSVIMYNSIKGQHIIYVFAKFQYQRCEEHPRKVKTVPYIKYSESRTEFIVYTRRQMEKPGRKCELGDSLTKGSWQSCWEASVLFPDCQSWILQMQGLEGGRDTHWSKQRKDTCQQVPTWESSSVPCMLIICVSCHSLCPLLHCGIRMIFPAPSEFYHSF